MKSRRFVQYQYGRLMVIYEYSEMKSRQLVQLVQYQCLVQLDHPARWVCEEQPEERICDPGAGVGERSERTRCSPEAEKRGAPWHRCMFSR